jgi:hypothetical protein
VDIPDRRDRRVQPKQEKLLAKVRKLLPSLDLRPAFAWAGTFAETTDGLPFFGAHPKYGPRVLFAMAYGGNGITYSMIGRGLIRAAVVAVGHAVAVAVGMAAAALRRDQHGHAAGGMRRGRTAGRQGAQQDEEKAGSGAACECGHGVPLANGGRV